MSRETSPPTTAEFEQLGSDWSECVVAKQAGALVAQRAVAALEEWGAHKSVCAIWTNGYPPCDCGLNACLVAWRKAGDGSEDR